MFALKSCIQTCVCVCVHTHVKGGKIEAEDDRDDSGRVEVPNSRSPSGKSLLGL